MQRKLNFILYKALIIIISFSVSKPVILLGFFFIHNLTPQAGFQDEAPAKVTVTALYFVSAIRMTV